MNIAIKKVKDAGDPERERLLLQVQSDDDIGRYAVFATSSAEDGGVSNKVDDTFWFPDYEVSAGDLVVLYTKGGTAKVKHNEDGTTSHFFFWGRKGQLWGESGRYAVLLLVRTWSALETAG